jgi:hypothetical protein
VRIGSKVGGSGFANARGETDGLIYRLGRDVRFSPQSLYQELAQGRMGCPSGQGIVANVDHSTRFELGIDEIDDRTPVLSAYPRPDPVQCYEIQARQAGRQSLREALIKKSNVLDASSRRKPLSAGDMSRIEVNAPK